MSLMSTLFGGMKQSEQQPVQQQNPTPATPGNLPNTPPEGATSTPNTDPNGTIPPTSSDPGKEDSTPLSKFNNLWEPVTNKEGQQESKPLDVTQLQEVIKTADFTKSLSPEQVQLIKEGGEGAMSAVLESMNTVAQQVLLQSALATDKMLEAKVAEAIAGQQAKLPDLIRQHNTSNSLTSQNPIFKNPAVKPVIEAVQHQLAAKNPDASPLELVEMTNNFVQAMAEAFTPKQVQTDGKKEIDWDSFMQQDNM